MDVFFYNTLTRQKEKFVSIDSSLVRMYCCGPTVYDYAQIGNWRTYTLSDLVVRVLKYNGYPVDYVMNLTDVGHLTGDNLGDADQGEDRLEKAAKAERKTAGEIADYYAHDFIESADSLNLTRPKVFVRATEHIPQQIDLIKRLAEKGFTYRISDGIYFDVRAYEMAGNRYGELSNLDEIREGARVEPNPGKKNPKDFALWKFSYKNGRDFDSAQDDVSAKRQMEWGSPWGLGFPGWHIECSAMSMKYLGQQFDIHIGGEDLRSTHHPNEVAQSEAATGKRPFVRYWVHGAFLLVDGGRMGKSQGNAYTLKDVTSQGYSPLALRYFYLSGHYRKQLNFTWEALAASQKALERLRAVFTPEPAPLQFPPPGGESDNHGLPGSIRENRLTKESNALIGCAEYEEKFLAAVNDDLDLPQALAIVWELTKSDYPLSAKKASLSKFDAVLGLDLALAADKNWDIPAEVRDWVKARETFRAAGNFVAADNLRRKIEGQGFSIEDTDAGPKVKKVTSKR